MTTEQYLKEHELGRDSYAIHYDSLKSAIIGSINGQVTTHDNSFYKYGLTSKEFYKKYIDTPEFEELALIGNTRIIGDKIG